MALVQKQFGDLITFTRSSAGGRYNVRGIYEMVPANQPRFNYDPVTLQPLGILTEESRTNYVKDSGFSPVTLGWYKSPGIVVGAPVVSPDGSLSGLSVTTTPGTGSFLSQVSTVPEGTNTYSLFCKAKEDSQFSLYFEFGSGTGGTVQFNAVSKTFSGGTPISTSCVEAGNGWVRISITVTSQKLAFYIGAYGPAPAVLHSGYIWGFQVESGSFPTSLIPTLASQVTRTADVVMISRLSPWYNPAGGTLFVDYTPGQIGIGSTNAGAYLCSANPSENVIVLRDGPVKGTIYGLMAMSAQEVVSSIIGARLGAGVPLKMAYSYSAESAALSVNGAAPVKGVTGKIAAPTRMFIGGAPNTQQLSNGHVRAVRYYPSKLTDAELQALTK